MPMTQVSDTCLDCNRQIWLDGETWIDNFGGENCSDEPHNPSGDEIMIMTKEKTNANL